MENTKEKNLLDSLSTTDIRFLLHLKINNGQEPKPSEGKYKGIETIRFRESRAKLLKEGILVPAVRNGVTISPNHHQLVNQLEAKAKS